MNELATRSVSHQVTLAPGDTPLRKRNASTASSQAVPKSCCRPTTDRLPRRPGSAKKRLGEIARRRYRRADPRHYFSAYRADPRQRGLWLGGLGPGRDDVGARWSLPRAPVFVFGGGWVAGRHHRPATATESQPHDFLHAAKVVVGKGGMNE